jgi:hypothetical protein
LEQFKNSSFSFNIGNEVRFGIKVQWNSIKLSFKGGKETTFGIKIQWSSINVLLKGGKLLIAVVCPIFKTSKCWKFERWILSNGRVYKLILVDSSEKSEDMFV